MLMLIRQRRSCLLRSRTLTRDARVHAMIKLPRSASCYSASMPASWKWRFHVSSRTRSPRASSSARLIDTRLRSGSLRNAPPTRYTVHCACVDRFLFSNSPFAQVVQQFFHDNLLIIMLWITLGLLHAHSQVCDTYYSAGLAGTIRVRSTVYVRKVEAHGGSFTI